MSDEQLDRPTDRRQMVRPGSGYAIWPTRADLRGSHERVIAEQCPTSLLGPRTFAAHLAYDHRSIGAELNLLTAVRQQVAAILRERGRRLSADGNHAEAGR